MNASVRKLLACALVAVLASGCAHEAFDPDARKRDIRASCEQLHPSDRFPGDGCDILAPAPPTPIATKHLPPEKPKVEAQSTALMPFPKTTTTPLGKPWMNQHEHGYTGSIQDGARLCRLTDDEAAYVESAFSAGTYRESDVPDGAVLDCLTFTRNGVHRAQKSVEVALEKGTVRSRRVRLIRLPNSDKYFAKFDGCNNLGLIRGVVTEAKASCKREYRVAVWNPASIQNYAGDPTLREDALSITGKRYLGRALSRTIGERLRDAERLGFAKKSRCVHRATFSLWHPRDPWNQESDAILGQFGSDKIITVKGGEYRIPTPSSVLESHAIRIDFPENFISPSRGEDMRRGVIAWRWEPRDCVVWIHAIAPEGDCAEGV